MALSSKIQTYRSGDTFMYVLPRRELGKFHLVGFAIIAVALIGFAIFGSVGWTIAKPHGKIDTFTIIFGLFITAMLLSTFVGLMTVIRFGLFVLWGHAEISIANDRVTTCERVGPIFRKRSRTVADFHRVNVIYGDGVMRVNGKRSNKFRELAKAAGLGMDGEGVKPMTLALAYPKEMLIGLGQDVARRLKLEFRAGDDEQMKDVIDAMKLAHEEHKDEA